VPDLEDEDEVLAEEPTDPRFKAKFKVQFSSTQQS
jgi:hypothetical protein